jgi:hypothetical protein
VTQRDGAGDPTRLSGSLARVVSSLGGPDLGSLRRLERAWAKEAPDEVVDRTRSVAIVDSRLVVIVDDPAAAGALRWHGPRLVAAVAAATGSCLVELVVRVRTAGVEPP